MRVCQAWQKGQRCNELRVYKYLCVKCSLFRLRIFNILSGRCTEDAPCGTGRPHIMYIIWTEALMGGPVRKKVRVVFDLPVEWERPQTEAVPI